MLVGSRAVLFVALLAGCTEKRFACQACLNDSSTCASSSIPPSRTEQEARCSAVESLCGTVDQKQFERLCKDKKFTVMFGCSKEVIDQFRFECTTTTHINVPLVLDL